MGLLNIPPNEDIAEINLIWPRASGQGKVSGKLNFDRSSVRRQKSQLCTMIVCLHSPESSYKALNNILLYTKIKRRSIG